MVFRVRWRWTPGLAEKTRARARLAIAAWLDAIGFASFSFSEAGRGQSLYVHGDDDLRASSRAIHSFVVELLEPGELDGPIRSGLTTSRRRALRKGPVAQAGLEAIMNGLRRLRGR
jgi:hypothetical protein